MKRICWLLMLVGVLWLSGSAAGADDFYVIAGDVPKTKITVLPYNITAPGFYYLSGNLTSATSQGITIMSDNVTLDLMGYCLRGSGNEHDSLLNGIILGGRNNVEIRNGTVRGFYDGINANNCAQTRVINVRVRENYNCGINLIGATVNREYQVKGCSAYHNGLNGTGSGIFVIRGQIIDCEASQNSGIGISLSGPGTVMTSTANYNATGFNVPNTGLAGKKLILENIARGCWTANVNPNPIVAPDVAYGCIF